MDAEPPSAEALEKLKKKVAEAEKVYAKESHAQNIQNMYFLRLTSVLLINYHSLINFNHFVQIS